MIHQARVSNRTSLSDNDAEFWGLEIGEVVTVVGFLDDSSGSFRAVVVSRGAYITCPHWLLDPLLDLVVT